jgi:CRISPR system Cascade subunit CasB
VIEPTPEKTPAGEPRSSVWHWWKHLAQEDRGGRAELRQCGTAAEVAFCAAYHRLLQRLGSRLGERDAQRVAVLAAVLAHVDEEPVDEASFARRMGTPKREGVGSLVSDARFRQLLRTDDPDELLRDLGRFVRQLDRRASVEPLFRDVMRWDEPTRMRWARDFYEAAPAAKDR